MGECHCSKIAIMQLFHELKQQFPALPDHVVSQCIAQNSHDREVCTRSLRAAQESRPPPGAFPPPAPPADGMSSSAEEQQQQQQVVRPRRPAAQPRPPRPVSLDIRCQSGLQQQQQQQAGVNLAQPSSAPAACSARGFFEESHLPSPSFEVNVNVACSPGGSHDHHPSSAPPMDPPSTFPQPPPQQQPSPESSSGTRSFTSVSLTLRPPSSEPQPAIDISSQGSSLTYSSSSSHPRGFQSHLQISIGHGGGGGAAGVTAARIRPQQQRPSSLGALNARRPPGLPAGPPSQLARPTSTMSAPTTPSGLLQSLVPSPTSLPVTPLVAPATSLGAVPRASRPELPPEGLGILEQVPSEYRGLVTEQLIRKERLTKALEEEKEKLESLNKEIDALSKPSEKSPKEIERQLRSEIYQLQLACDKLAEEVDKNAAGSRIPLGETNEEFYQGIYTGQQFIPAGEARGRPPPLPSQPPALEPSVPRQASGSQEEADGPRWICPNCTFDNHPLMNKCEECDLPRLGASAPQGETQDIHIRVTHHHNFPPGRTVHNWVV